MYILINYLSFLIHNQLWSPHQQILVNLLRCYGYHKKIHLEQSEKHVTAEPVYYYGLS